MTGSIHKVVVAGAGPAGLLATYMLAKEGISVDVLEAKATIDTSPRGLAYGPSAKRVLQDAGLLDKITSEGFLSRDFTWRKLDGTILVYASAESDRDAWVVNPVGSISALLLDLVQKMSIVTIHWNCRVVDVGQDEIVAWVDAVDPSGNKSRWEADYVIGCEGAQSAVRKSLFNGRFPGYTWPAQLIAVNFSYDFLDKAGWADAQWVVDQEKWFLCARINRKGLWRMAYGETPGLSIEEIRKRLDDRFRTTLPGNPEPHQFQVMNLAPYTIHQRLAERMRVGRVLLAADAAHLCNPMGGLGLTTGIADIGSLVQALVGIHTGQTTDIILDIYDEKRRAIFSTITDPISTTNMKRIMSDANEVEKSDPFFDNVRQAVEDPILREEAFRPLTYMRNLEADGDRM
ncbi:uncharacterized protein A1O9_07271 [Exophiala aquamarina CBS 119918]|uniref:FAD-binding domain-containing protein n=1 Tax=Exophiala aquamarina CBS 119918 TaxID=1182545 RepID=A0A072PB22_9EURO|nr:uncharacterized protein A1O9_07271 [Exophiala aquamarina CBS 119918]KEF57081.1 hypothetical protein A1O9_07271 [Exophiala aquamarina CBS 119918]